MTVTAAGLLMLPSAFMMLVAGPAGGQLGNRFGFRAVLAAGALFSSASFLVLAVAHSAEWHFGLANVLLGVGLSFSFASMANIIVSSVPPQDVGIATGINTVTRTVGGAFGSALVTALLTAETLPGTAIPAEGAYSEAFVAATVAGFVAFAATLAIPRMRSGREAAPVATRDVAEGVAA
jgi:MFS family permease